MGFYEKHYKKLMIIPFLILLLAIGQIAYQMNTTGDFVDKSIRLKGGATVKTEEVLKEAQMVSYLEDKFPEAEIFVEKDEEGSGSIILASIGEDQREEFNAAIEEKGVTISSFSSEDPEFSASLYRSMMYTILIAFILMGIVVFISFRTFVPSFAVILSAFSDIVVTLAIFNLLEFKLLKGGLAAFLMLIGYSVDTDILLTNKVLKGKIGTPYSRLKEAMSTGLKMSATTIIAIGVAYTIAIPVDFKQIMIILLIGLIVDLMNTWIQNAGILRWYMEKKHGKN